MAFSETVPGYAAADSVPRFVHSKPPVCSAKSERMAAFSCISEAKVLTDSKHKKSTI
jgi:hypothetical protein